MKKVFKLNEILKAFNVKKEDELPWQTSERGSYLQKSASKGSWFLIKQDNGDFLGLLTPNGTAADLE